MNNKFLAAGFSICLITATYIYAADVGQRELGNLGELSTGHITIQLEITEDVTAGFIQTNLDDPGSLLNEMLSAQLVQSIKNEIDTTIPLCVMSSGGGYFEVTFFEVPGSSTESQNGLYTAASPIEISFGEGAGDTIKYQSVTDDCNADTAIPVTINLNEQYSGNEVGRIYGKFNLLVKSE